MISFLVLNIILSAFTLCLIVPDSISISHPWLSISRFPFNCDYGVGPFDRPCTRDSSGFLALYVLMLILAVVQAVTAIVASGFSCAAVCCGKNSNFHGTLIFAPAPVALNGQTETRSEGKNI